MENELNRPYNARAKIMLLLTRLINLARALIFITVHRGPRLIALLGCFVNQTGFSA